MENSIIDEFVIDGPLQVEEIAEMLDLFICQKGLRDEAVEFIVQQTEEDLDTE